MVDIPPNRPHGDRALQLPPLPPSVDHVHECFMTVDHEFVVSADHLVRSLYDLGLRLNHAKQSLGPPDSPAARTLTDLVDHLDQLINNTALTMLARVSHYQPTPRHHRPPTSHPKSSR